MLHLSGCFPLVRMFSICRNVFHLFLMSQISQRMFKGDWKRGSMPKVARTWFVIHVNCWLSSIPSDAGTHLKQGKQVVAVVDGDLEEGEEHDGHNPDVEARLSTKEVRDGTEGWLYCRRNGRKEWKLPEDEGAQNESHHSKSEEVSNIVSNPTDPIVLGDEGVLELGVVVSPLLAAGELGVCLRWEEKRFFHSFLPCKENRPGSQWCCRCHSWSHECSPH